MSKPVFYLQGNKVGLRAFEKDDLVLYKKWLSDPEVTKYLEMGWQPYTDSALEAVYQEADNDPNSVVMTVCDLKTGQPLGTTGFYLINWPGKRAQHRILLGEPSFFGKGYGTETNKIMIEYGFNRLNLNTIYLGVNAENKGAIKSYLNAGFIEEGKQREFVYNNGQYYDSIFMSILAKDFHQK